MFFISLLLSLNIILNRSYKHRAPAELSAESNFQTRFGEWRIISPIPPHSHTRTLCLRQHYRENSSENCCPSIRPSP
jgi:hypothetical protein